MKGIFNGINCWYWSMLFLSFSHAVPIQQNPSNETIAESGSADKNLCFYHDEQYSEGQNRPTANPCETCTCQPPDFSCRLKNCTVKVGCKIIHSAGHCCPNYICDCQKDGRTYGNGEKVEEPNPCNVCYCRGGEIKCTGVTCYTRTDCQPHYVPGKCCPKYDHCPALEMTGRPALLLTTTIAPTIDPSLATIISDTENTNKSVGMLEIIEIYPSTQSDEVLQPTTTLLEETTALPTGPVDNLATTEFFKHFVTANDTEEPVIITAYSRVSIDSPKLNDNVETTVETAEPTVDTKETTESTVEIAENTETTVEIAETTETIVEIATSTETTVEMTETTTEMPETTLIYEETDNDTETSTAEYSISENPTETVTVYYEKNETTDSVTEFVEPIQKAEKIQPTKKPIGPATLVDILLKWLQSKRKIEKTSTAAPELNATQDARSENPISFLTILQTQLLRIANETQPNDESNRGRSLDFDNGTLDENVEISRQEIADLAAVLNHTSSDRIKYPLTDENLAPVLSMISDQLQFLKVGEEQPIYMEAPPDDEDKIEKQHGVVVVPTSPPITVQMIKVVDGQRKDDGKS